MKTDWECAISLANDWLANNMPSLHQRIQGKNRLWPLICATGHEGSTIMMKHLPSGNRLLVPNEEDRIDPRVAGDHFMAGMALYLALEGEDANLQFFDEMTGFIETPLGHNLSFFASDIRRNRSLLTQVRFRASLKCEGFLECFNQWRWGKDDDVDLNGKLDFNDLFDPRGYGKEYFWNSMAKMVFSSGNHPTRDELAEFCRNWVKAEDASKRKQQRKQSRSGESPLHRDCPKLVDACWISDALWCQDTGSIVELLAKQRPDIIGEDGIKAASKINQAINILGFKRFQEHQGKIDSALEVHRKFMAKLVKN